MLRVWVTVATSTGIVLAAWVGYRQWPRTLEIHPAAAIPVWERSGDREVVKMPSRALVAEIGVYDDELFAYMMFEYFACQRRNKTAAFSPAL
jgi:hypothetical protein